MNKVEKIKRVILIILGFAISIYLIYSGLDILEKDTTSKEQPQHNSQ